MPAARGAPQAGLTTAHVWMIAFVILWLVSTGLLVWVYTDQEAVKSANSELQDENRRLISGAERSLPYFSQADERRTVVGLLEAARARTAELATGTGEDNATAVEAKTREITGMIANNGLVPDAAAFQGASLAEALKALYTTYKGAHDQLETALTQLGELNERVESLAASNAAAASAFDEAVAALQQKLSEVEASRTQYREQRDQEFTAFDARIDEIRQEASRDGLTQRNKIERLNSDLKEVRTRFAEVQAKLGEQQIKPKPLQTLRQPDGIVVTAKPGEDVVYIDVGRDGHLTLGLQFAVYSRQTGIPADGTAKARIEVVSIYEQSAACRIVEVHGNEQVIEHDLIANPIYDRQRPLKFIVIGGFDLNGDKQPDADGLVRLEAVIEEWGGELASAVSAGMDFVVAGSPPQEPRIVGEQTAEHRVRMQDYEEALARYTEQLGAAQSLGIPVLSQQVLVHFLGFAGNTLDLGT